MGIKCPLCPDQGQSEQANSGGFSGIQHPPIANLSKSIASDGRPQTMRLKLPTVPQLGQGEVFTVTLLLSIFVLLFLRGYRPSLTLLTSDKGLPGA